MTLIEILKKQESFRSNYWKKIDYFLPQRLKWRAEMARHLFHLFPHDSILEIGCGSGEWTREISAIKRNSNPICAVTFDIENFDKIKTQGIPENIEPLLMESFPGPLEGRQFDFVIAWGLLTDKSCAPLLMHVKNLLKPGGQILLFDPNPWNPYYNIRRLLTHLFSFSRRDKEEASFNRLGLFSILSEIGFIKINILPYDFLFPPIPKFLFWSMKNLSLIFENTPYLRNFAGTLYIWAHKPSPDNWKRPMSSLTEHKCFFRQVSFVIPCHNEEPNIPSLIKNLKACYNDYIHEIILVDDNSTDNTANVGEQISQNDPRIRVIRRSMPNGVGRALRDGYLAATGNYVMTMDCDFQHIVPEMTGLFDAVFQGTDVAIGSRFSRNSILLNYAFTKILANRAFHIIANILVGKKFRDVTNNLKLMKIDVVKKLHIESEGFSANAETGLKPILMGYNVQEVPISWINRSLDMGFSSFNLVKTGPGYFFTLFRLLLRKWLGKEIAPPPSK